MLGDAEPLLKVQVTIPEPGVCVVHAVGEIDMMTAPALDNEISERLLARPRLVILDFSGVTFLASTGLATLMSVREGCRAIGATLRLVGRQARLLRPIDLTGLTELFELYPDLAAALRGPIDGVRR
jgi:anti-anti-sigma factor